MWKKLSPFKPDFFQVAQLNKAFFVYNCTSFVLKVFTACLRLFSQNKQKGQRQKSNWTDQYTYQWFQNHWHKCHHHHRHNHHHHPHHHYQKILVHPGLMTVYLLHLSMCRCFLFYSLLYLPTPLLTCVCDFLERTLFLHKDLAVTISLLCPHNTTPSSIKWKKINIFIQVKFDFSFDLSYVR